MKLKKAACLSVAVLLLLASLLAAGCSGAGGKKAALAPSDKNGVDAVLQQQMKDADAKAGAGTNTRGAEEKPAGAAKTPAPVSAQQMKEMEEKIPRMDVYDEKLIYTKVDEPIIVTGRFSSYKEGNQLYCELAEAELQKL